MKPLGDLSGAVCWEVIARHHQAQILGAVAKLGLCRSLMGMLCTWSTFQDLQVLAPFSMIVIAWGFVRGRPCKQLVQTCFRLAMPARL